MRGLFKALAIAVAMAGSSAGAIAQTASQGQIPNNAEAEACRNTGLIALKERNPAIKDVTLDLDGLTIAKANVKVEDTQIRTIVIGDAYLEKGKTETRRTFLCLIGDKGRVLLTFFTDK